MQSFTTQSHQRNYQGNVVVDNRARSQAKSHKGLAIVTTSVMALAVAVTGSMLGATALHNQALKNELHALQTQTAEMTTTMESMQTMDDMVIDEKYFYPTMTLEARPENTDAKTEDADVKSADTEGQYVIDNNGEPKPAPRHDGHKHRRHGEKRALRRIPISDQEHEAQPLPALDNHHNNHHENAN